jgi:SAM-dependent methyltransferase
VRGAYGHSPLEDAIRAARAIATNQLARFMPGAYVRVTGETGRGREAATPAETAGYFWQCVQDYLDVLAVAPADRAGYWRGRDILEYGPGDIPGVALLLAGLGARSVLCVDRFPLVRFDPYQCRVIDELARLLPDDESRARFWNCFRVAGDPAGGLGDGPVRYLIAASGLAGVAGGADVVISRAVLEHVNDLTATFDDMARVLRPGGIAVHKVDLKSHGLHRQNRLDFLTWPEPLWRLMFSEKGAPNRIRAGRYRDEAARCGFELVTMEPCEQATPAEVAEVRPHLAEPFRALDDAELSWLSFWLVVRMRDASAPRRA